MQDKQSYFVSGDKNPTFKWNGISAPGLNFDLSPDYVPETLFIIGNGAVRGANQVIESALQDYYKNKGGDIFEFSRSRLPLDMKLALESFTGRMMWASLQQEVLGDKEDGKDTNQHAINECIGGIRRDLEIRNAISKGLERQKLELREFPEAMKPFLGPGSAFITTNWDNSVWDAPEFPTGLYLHGRCEFGPSLILQTEMAMDDKIHEFSLKKISERAPNSKIYGEIMNVLGDSLNYWSWSSTVNHAICSELLVRSKRIFVWGCAFNTYDAEIISLIRAGALGGQKIDRFPREVVVINTNGHDAQLGANLLGVTDFRGIIPGD